MMKENIGLRKLNT